MKILQRPGTLLAVLGVMSLAVTAHAGHFGPDARSLREVDAVWVDSNGCSASITDQLRQNGFRVASSPRAADAILVVDVSGRSADLDNAADYEAKLRGSNDFVIFSASGTKYSRSTTKLCEDIGDSIARSMNEMS